MFCSAVLIFLLYKKVQVGLHTPSLTHKPSLRPDEPLTLITIFFSLNFQNANIADR